jgi:hypothetical protein
MAPKEKKAMEMGCTAMGQKENLVLALGSTQQHFRRKYTPLRYVQSRIYRGTRRIEALLFYQIVKLQLKHLVNTGSPETGLAHINKPATV